MAIEPHKQIIKNLCKDILLPLGVFQKGASRIYVDDNGYFFTVIEFQPSTYAKGTYLNVVLHFLWNERENISYDFPFGNEMRIGNFIEYHNEEQFTHEVTQYVQEAAKQVLFYQKLQDIEIAKSYARKWSRKFKGNSRISELEKINRLDDEEVLQKIKRTRAFWRSKPSMKKMKIHDFFDA
ncbi:MAG: hypothetical protein E7462_06650 [Ruminococcaceae bacterium]|nr:hypothetical protein [Oscillospiraceae bacterium]